MHGSSNHKLISETNLASEKGFIELQQGVVVAERAEIKESRRVIKGGKFKSGGYF